MACLVLRHERAPTAADERSPWTRVDGPGAFRSAAPGRLAYTRRTWEPVRRMHAALGVQDIRSRETSGRGRGPQPAGAGARAGRPSGSCLPGASGGAWSIPSCCSSARFQMTRNEPIFLTARRDRRPSPLGRSVRPTTAPMSSPQDPLIGKPARMRAVSVSARAVTNVVTRGSFSPVVGASTAPSSRPGAR